MKTCFNESTHYKQQGNKYKNSRSYSLNEPKDIKYEDNSKDNKEDPSQFLGMYFVIHH